MPSSLAPSPSLGFEMGMIPLGRAVAAQQSPFWSGEHAVRWHGARGVWQQGAEGTVTLQHVTLC